LLPVALVALGAPGPFWLVRALVVLAGLLAFAALMVPAVRTVFGVSRPIAAGVVAVAGFALPLSVFVPYLASPFVLYLGWLFLRGELGDVRASLSGRRSFKRFLEAATLNPRDAEAHYNLGLLHLQRGQLAEARSRFERAVEIDRGELDAHYQLGRLARTEKRAEDAIRHFEAVVARDEAYARHEVWREIGATYLEAESLEHARWALEKFVARLLGDAHARAGDAARARELFGRCVEAVDTMPGFRQREVARWKREAQKRIAALGGKP
jgi:tetratricopeptide (TPR) repeat protein